MHALEYGITDMLQGYIHVLAHVVTLTHYREQVKREVVGIAVVQAQPLHSGKVRQTLYQFCKRRLMGNVRAVICQILGNQLNLLNALGNQFAGLIQDILLAAGLVFAGHKGYCAVCAAAVAALGNLQICVM